MSAKNVALRSSITCNIKPKFSYYGIQVIIRPPVSFLMYFPTLVSFIIFISLVFTVFGLFFFLTFESTSLTFAQCEDFR